MKKVSESGDNRVVIITGSTRGIGFAAAAEFIRHGDRVVIFCRHKDHVDEATQRLREIASPDGRPQNVLGLVGDVRNLNSVRAIVDATLKEFSRIDVLINNAGVAVWKPIEQTGEQEWDDIIDINLKGSFLFMHEVIPLMRKQNRGVIINISSGLGVQGSTNYSAYSASKFGQVSLTQVAADELSDTNVKVYAVLPGAVATKLHLDIHPWEDPASMMTPEHIAKKIFQTAEGTKRSGKLIEVYS